MFEHELGSNLSISITVFLDGDFSKFKLKWGMSHEEMIPIVKAFDRIKFLLKGHLGELHLLNDQKNLVHIPRPERSENLLNMLDWEDNLSSTNTWN